LTHYLDWTFWWIGRGFRHRRKFWQRV